MPTFSSIPNVSKMIRTRDTKPLNPLLLPTSCQSFLLTETRIKQIEKRIERTRKISDFTGRIGLGRVSEKIQSKIPLLERQLGELKLHQTSASDFLKSQVNLIRDKTIVTKISARIDRYMHTLDDNYAATAILLSVAMVGAVVATGVGASIVLATTSPVVLLPAFVVAGIEIAAVFKISSNHDESKRKTSLLKQKITEFAN